MHAYRLRITLQDPLFYASRELGRNYITERYLHNYALTYALGFATSTYHDAVQVPRYQEDLQPVNQKHIYVTPAKPISMETRSTTFKYANVRYHVQMEPSSINIPTFGKARELMPETEFEAFVMSRESIRFPLWIRLGKWMGKAEVKVTEAKVELHHADEYVVRHPLNPLDVPEPVLYDLIHMPPVSLIENGRFAGEHWQLIFDDASRVLLPKNMQYRFG